MTSKDIDNKQLVAKTNEKNQIALQSSSQSKSKRQVNVLDEDTFIEVIFYKN
jgi:hypothetical protein